MGCPDAVIERIERTVRRHDSGKYLLLPYLSCRYGDNGDGSNHYTNFHYERTLCFSLNHTHGTRCNTLRILYDPRTFFLLLLKHDARDVQESLTYIITLLMSSQIVSYACTVRSTSLCMGTVCMQVQYLYVHSNDFRRSLIRFFVELLVSTENALLIIKLPEDLKSLPGHCHRGHSPLENYNKGAYGMALLFNLRGQDRWSLCWQHRS